MNQKLLAPGHSTTRTWLLVGAGLGVSLLWAYWTFLRDMEDYWRHDPRYSHGYFVPLFALVLLWLRRPYLALVTPQVNLAGLALLGGAAALHIAGGRLNLDWIDGFSFL